VSQNKAKLRHRSRPALCLCGGMARFILKTSPVRVCDKCGMGMLIDSRRRQYLSQIEVPAALANHKETI